MADRLKTLICRFFRENAALILIVPVVFICGALIGVLAVKELNNSQVNELTKYVDGFIKYLPTANFDSRMEAAHALDVYLKTLFFTWFLGLTVIGIPLTMVITFTRGFILGFTTGFLVAQKAFQGILVVFLTVLPQNVLFVPVFLIGAVSSLSFSLYIIRGRFMGKTINLSKRFFGYTLCFFILSVFASLAALVQGYVTPSLVRAVFYFS